MTTLAGQYFLNHRLDEQELAWQVEELAAGGYELIYAHARQGLLTPYMSEAWWQAIDKIMAVCREKGLKFGIWDEDYYPSGLAGGRIVWAEPGFIARELEFTCVERRGTGPFEVDFTPGMLLRAFAIEKKGNKYGEPLDITKFCGTRRQKWTDRWLKHSAYSPMLDQVGHPHWRSSFIDNRFAVCWQPPHPGEYLIVGVVVKPTDNLCPDILRPEGVKRFIELSYEPYYQRYREDFGKLIEVAFTDEPRPGALLFPWTPGFAEGFYQDHGYDLLAYLPHLVVDIDGRSPAIRHHYRLTQHRLQYTYYVKQIAEWCEAHGIMASGHLPRTEWLSLGAVRWPNMLRCYKPMHIPATDPLGGSCGFSDAAAYHTGVKVASSAAHLFGRTQASSDTLAVIGDESSLRDLKYYFDYQMVLGINHFTVHGLSYSLDGPRKDEVPPSLFYQHTEWPYMRTLLDYVRKTCKELTGGQHLCELAVLYPSTSLVCQITPATQWALLPDEASIHQFVETLLSHQRDFDFLDEITLAENMSATGELATPERYRIILLPYLRYIDQQTAIALNRFTQAGGRVIAVGTLPKAINHNLKEPLLDWQNEKIEFWEGLDEAKLASLPGLPVQGSGARDIFVLQRAQGEKRRIFVFNRGSEGFHGIVGDTAVSIPARGSVLLSEGASIPQESFVETADISEGWTVTFAPNHIPLNFWHVETENQEYPPFESSPFTLPGFNLMQRQADPAGDGEGLIRYYCRFMLTGNLPDGRLVMDDSAITGQWELFVNGVQIKDWQRSTVFDCRNLEAPISHALRSNSNPALNVIMIQTKGAGRGLKEIPYLYGNFTCEYRYGHLSYPFLKGMGDEKSIKIESLLPWDTLGYPTFSGAVIYQQEFEVTERGELVLDLGRVEDLAAVRVDDKEYAVLAWPPYRCRLADLKSGWHQLTITVCNAPANRNRAAGFPAGLLGPVKLEVLKNREKTNEKR